MRSYVIPTNNLPTPRGFATGSLGSGSGTRKIDFSSIKTDTANGFNLTTDRYVIQPGFDGIYQIGFSGNATTKSVAAQCYFYIQISGGTTYSFGIFSGGDEHSGATVLELDLIAGDYIEVYMVMTSGNAACSNAFLTIRQ